MKIGIVLQSNKPEHVWNTFRFGIAALQAHHEVSIFLMNEGTESLDISDTNVFDISRKITDYSRRQGKILACGTCLELRGIKESGVCTVSTMADLVKLVEINERVLVFG